MGNLILEGPAALIKMRIKEGETVVESIYSDEYFLRITQHMPFMYKDKILSENIGNSKIHIS